MPEHTTMTAGSVSIRVTCDRRGCPAVGGAATPVDPGETTAAALTRCRDIVGASWRLDPGLTLCSRCVHHPAHDQPTLAGLSTLPEAR